MTAYLVSEVKDYVYCLKTMDLVVAAVVMEVKAIAADFVMRLKAINVAETY
jgi:hypothetical protein